MVSARVPAPCFRSLDGIVSQLVERYTDGDFALVPKGEHGATKVSRWFGGYWHRTSKDLDLPVCSFAPAERLASQAVRRFDPCQGLSVTELLGGVRSSGPT